MKKTLLSMLVAAAMSSGALAGDKNGKYYEGCYDAEKGKVETMTTVFEPTQLIPGTQIPLMAEMEQQGTFKIRLKNADRPDHMIHRNLKIEGVVTGMVEIDFSSQEGTGSHILTNDKRTGIIYTAADTSGFWIDEDSCVLNVTQTIYPVSGTGVYGPPGNPLPVAPGQSAIDVEGTVNLCTGRNDFKVVGGEVCFEVPSSQ